MGEGEEERHSKGKKERRGEERLPLAWRDRERSGGGASAERGGEDGGGRGREGAGERTREGERHSSERVVKLPRLPRTRFVLFFLFPLSSYFFS